MLQASRFLFLALLAWWTLGFAAHPLNGGYIGESFLHLINLPFHEAGHILFSPFGAFMTSLGGSLMQVLIPLVCIVSFVKREDIYAASVCAWWAGQNLVDLAPYIADARALQLVLLGGHTGAEVEGHDWEAILTSLGWLGYDRTLGYVAHWTGALTMVGAIGFAGWSSCRPGLVERPQPAGRPGATGHQTPGLLSRSRALNEARPTESTPAGGDTPPPTRRAVRATASPRDRSAGAC